MNRNEFLKVCAVLGISLPFSSTLKGCVKSDDMIPMRGNEKIIIIGAGPAGMSAAYLLAQQGIDFQVLEALPTHGGRIKHNTTFSNFPISLGGEWMHVANSGNNILSEIVNDTTVGIATQMQGYDLSNDSSGYFDGTSLALDTLGNHFGNDFADKKFVGSSWLDFFETYILPSVQSKITFNTPVTAIDYATDDIVVTAQSGETFRANKVIVAVPLKILQNGMINFTPVLPDKKQEAIRNVKVWSGFKAFFKFTTKFYPTYISFPNSATPEGQLQYYDAAYAQNTSDHILGLFSTGAPAEIYQSLSANAQRDYILNELDTIFGSNIASSSYIEHIVQSWNKEPYANGAYATAYEDWRVIRTLGESIHNKIYFAGDAYTTGTDWSSVHAAARSARRAVEELVG
ncbi:MAG: FAD-dependent oxidoreductase [Bacteroidota bacterium]